MIKYPFLVGLRTARPVARIESWLAAYCDGRWQVRLDEIAPDLSHKYLVVSFELARDRAAFKKAFAKSAAAPGKTEAKTETEALAQAETAGSDTAAA